MQRVMPEVRQGDKRSLDRPRNVSAQVRVSYPCHAPSSDFARASWTRLEAQHPDRWLGPEQDHEQFLITQRRYAEDYSR